MSKTFCPLPWIHLATHPHGSVTLCCESDHEHRRSESYDFDDAEKEHKYKTLNTEKFDFKVIHNSDSFRDVRLKMLSDKQPEQCKSCFDKEKVGVLSKRTLSLREINYSYEDAIRETSETGEIPVNFEFVELRLGNHCNLACRTCNMYSSSRWMSEVERSIGTKLRIDKTIFNWPLDPLFWEALFEHRKTIRKIYINGGEPLLIDKHKDFLERLVASGDSVNIELLYSTNATIINREYDSVWKKFKSIHFMISIDDLGDRNHYIRWPSNWVKTIETFKWIKQLCDENSNMSYVIMQTVSLFNVFYLKEFEDYFSQYKSSIIMNFVSQPAHFDISNLPREIKDIILQKIIGSACEQTVSNYMKIERNTSNIKQFLWEVRKIDNQRNESYEKIFPEFYGILV